MFNGPSEVDEADVLLPPPVPLLATNGGYMEVQQVDGPAERASSREMPFAGVARSSRRFKLRLLAVGALVGVVAVAAVVAAVPGRAASYLRGSPQVKVGGIDEGASALTHPTTTQPLPTTTGKEGELSKTFVIGQEVEAKLKSGLWNRGRIKADFQNNTYEIVWRDGQLVDTFKQVAEIRKEFNPTEEVYAHRSGGPFAKGTVVKDGGDGTFQIQWADGQKVDEVKGHQDLIMAFDLGMAIEGTRSGISGNDGKIVQDKKDGTFVVQWKDGYTKETVRTGDFLRRAVHIHQEIEATRAGVPVVRGVVKSYEGKGQYLIEWQDGQKIEELQDGTNLRAAFTMGQPIEAQKADGTYATATIVIDHGGDAFTVNWDDKSTQNRFRSGKQLRKVFQVGHEVVSTRGGKQYRATVTKVLSGGEYEVQWADGATTETKKSCGQMYRFLQVGDEVMGVRGGIPFFEGTVVKDYKDGSYLLNWKDGYQQDRIKKGNEMRVVKKASSKSELAFGTLVLARYWGAKNVSSEWEWANARIVGKNAKGQYVILYEDGRTRELDKWDWEVRRRYDVGDVILAKMDAGSLKKGTISKKNKDGSYTILYEDGSKEETTKPGSKLMYAFEVGMAVQGTRSGVPGNIGTISKDNGDGTFVIQWLDGSTTETTKSGFDLLPVVFVGREIEGTRSSIPGVRGKAVKYLGKGNYQILWKDGSTTETTVASIKLRMAFSVGMYIETLRGEYKGCAGEWAKAQIIKENGGGNFTLKWLDGMKLETVKSESGFRKAYFAGQAVAGARAGVTELKATVAADMMNGRYKVTWADGQSPKGEDVKPCESIHLAYANGAAITGPRGGVLGFEGTTSKDFKDGLYLVDWKDGVLGGRVRKGDECDKVPVVDRSMYRIFYVNQQIEARWFGAKGEVEGNLATWKRGRIAKDNGDHSYVIVWADGASTETTKKSYNIRRWYANGAQIKSASGRRGLVNKYYGNGTYDCTWDDGSKKEATRRWSAIQLVFVKGQKVKGEIQGAMKTGTISKENDDGTYDVDWDDGSTAETTKHAFGLCLTQSGKYPFYMDEDVEANRKGGALTRGKIVKDFKNQSYLVEWGDGSKEDKMQPSGGDLYRVFFVDELVEGRRKGATWVRGTIAKDHKNGSYDVTWKDGDKTVPMMFCDDLRRAFDKGDAVKGRCSDAKVEGEVTADKKDGTYEVKWPGGKDSCKVQSGNALHKGLKTTPTMTTTRGPQLLNGDHHQNASSKLVIIKWFVQVGDKVNTSTKICRVKEVASGAGRRLAVGDEYDMTSDYNGTVSELHDNSTVYPGDDLIAVNDIKPPMWWILLLLLLCCLMCILIICIIFCCRQKEEEKPQPKPDPQPKQQAAPPPPPPPTVSEPAPVQQTPPPAPPPPPSQPQGIRIDFKYPGDGRVETKYFEYRPLGAQLGRRHDRTDIEKFHFNSYCEHLGVPVGSQIVRIQDQVVPEKWDHHKVANEVHEALKDNPVWPLRVVFETPDSQIVEKLFTKHPIGIDFTRHAPIKVHAVKKGSHAEEKGVQHDWKIVEIHTVDTHNGQRDNLKGHMSFNEVNKCLHDGLAPLDADHRSKKGHEHHC